MADTPSANIETIAIGSDHAGFRLKQAILEHLKSANIAVIDFGTDSEAPVDYPLFCIRVAEAVANGQARWGIVLGGSGQGEQISANKVRGIRAALCDAPHYAVLARSHNNANVLAIGGRMVASELAIEIVETFRTTPFSAEERHQRRLDEIAEYEAHRQR